MLLLNETQKKLEGLLVANKVVTAQQLEQLKLESTQTGQPLLALLTARNIGDNETLVRLIAEASELPYANTANFTAAPEVMKLVPKDLAESYRIVPLGFMNGKVAVGMIDPANVQTVDFVSRRIGKPIVPYMVSEASVKNVLKQYDVTDQVSAVIDVLENEGTAEQKSDAELEYEKAHKQKEATKLENIVQDAPISRALKTIIEYAIQEKASDIHIEPREDALHIRFRVDGVLREIMKLNKRVEAALVSRIKILSNLKIDEHRLPQDGEFRVNAEGRDIDLRIAISPVIHGEQVIIRILDKDASMLTFQALGFRGRSLRLIQRGMNKPHGMILSTGPTGSGKSTTLYTIIQNIERDALNVVTLEDPVEYKMEGINQMQVNNQVGLTFASGLRSILRQDPDVVMVGEIRDDETADLAVQAALTGHIVLSTLHTNSASGLLPRMIDMGIEPFLIASTLNVAIGQRLLRKICEKCKETYESSEAEAESINFTLKGVLPVNETDLATAKEYLGFETLPTANQKRYTLFRGRGCNECKDGYKGRMGIYEVFEMSEGLQHLLSQRATSVQLQNQAIADGMITMKQDGYLKALNGFTTLTEVVRVASDA